ncbi:hypothetical protein [Nocardioides daphniae]|uniref:Uncharacterized protein n=1 Tax=Nocardioides daphniae TaxID=402297 RepID=A0A4V1CWS9_9ACTN|nr:hypothetical protein [Nocardioides daphniae]QCC78327.1 hypothetical protein E2C04_16040 [Nocardioides daphniae]GGD13540.1 hypothetical protein GCM10007231_10720 [Nocardioides daphniae]
MMFSAKAVFTERRSGVANMVAGITGQGMALMALRSQPGWNGMLVDEIVLATPGGWTEKRLETFLLAIGASTVKVVPVDVDGRAQGESGEREARMAHPAGSNRAWMARAS